MPSEAGEPVYRLAVAPRFSISPAWQERLSCCEGVLFDAETGAARPRGDWVAVDESTLAALVDADVTRAPELPPTHLGLVQVPERLRRAWWTSAEQAGGAPGAAVDAVLTDIAEFLRFKRLPFPGRAFLEVVVSAPGHDAPTGLGFGERQASTDAPGRLPLGLVNLGDEESFLALLTLPAQTLSTRLVAAGVRDADILAPQPLARRYLTTFPAARILRIRLEPGEGLWLSPFGVIHGGWTEGKTDVEVILRVG